MSLRDKINELKKWGKGPQKNKAAVSSQTDGEKTRQDSVSDKQAPPQAMPTIRTPTSSGAISLAELALQNLEGKEFGKAVEQKKEELPQAEPILPKCGMQGQVFNGLYKIEKLLAQGGMGQVFLASHLDRDHIPVVLKLLLKQADSESVEYSRFVQEMLISGRMRHPNLIKVYDYGILLDSLTPYLVMEFAEGESLRMILRRTKKLSALTAVQVALQCCAGLHEVHVKGIVHRDLKPENLMIKGDYQAPDNVKILDFGIAQLQNRKKFDEEGLAIGSVGYMSPEQICAQSIDHRTDIYSLGLILYESLTGMQPFVGSSRRETMSMHLKSKHMPPSSMIELPMAAQFDGIIERALAKSPDDRYQNAQELHTHLMALESRLRDSSKS